MGEKECVDQVKFVRSYILKHFHRVAMATSKSTLRVGWVGLGTMGSAHVANLLKKV